MPFKVVAVAGGYKVQDDKGKFYSDKPLSRQAAARQARALYSNVPEARKPGASLAVHKALAILLTDDPAAPTGFSVFKDKQGALRWVLFSSNAYRDHDDEIIATNALESDVERSLKETEPGSTPDYGPLRWWHVDGADLGRCDFRTTSASGRTLIESGTFRNALVGEKVKQVARKLQVSIGFNHPPDEPDRQGVYHTIRVFERSILPKGRAANPFTQVMVTGDEPMATKEEKLKALRMLLGDGEQADAIFQQAEQAEKELDAAGVAFKEGQVDPEPAAVTDAATEAGGDAVEPEEEKAKKKPAPEPEADAEDEGEPEDLTDADMEEEYLESDAGEEEEDVVGNMPVNAYKAMLKEAFGEALAPVTKALCGDGKGAMHGDGEDKKKESEAPAQPDPKVVQLEQTIKELQQSLATVTAELKELRGETPRAARGYVASQAADTIADAATSKELGGPKQDPYAIQFVNNLLDLKPGG